MVLAMLLVSDTVCRNQPWANVWLLVAGVAYPHVSQLLFGRFEGRRRGYAIFVVDGLFSGAVIAAVGLASVPSAVLAAINLFNWMIIGGPALVALGVTAALAGIALSDAPAIATANVCVTSDVVAEIVLITYFFVIARFIHRDIAELRQQHAEFQAESDAAVNARKLADRTLLSILPNSAGRVLAETGELPPATLDSATVLLVEFGWLPSKPPSVSDLADCFKICDTIMNRHGVECIKTFGRRYLAMSREVTGPDDAIAAVRELSSYLCDHRSMQTGDETQRIVKAFLHCGDVTAGLVQPARQNYDLLGDAIEFVHALAELPPGEPMATIVASAAAYRRLRDTAGFVATTDKPDTIIYLSHLTPMP